MAYTDNNTIALKISPESPYFEGELLPGQSIKPGMLCWIAPLDPDKYEAHSQDGWEAERLFAVENGYEGKEINDTYSDGERVYMRYCRPGDLVLAKYGAIGVTCNKGNKLVSKGDGTLREWVPGDRVGSIVGVALQDITAPAAIVWLAIRAF